MDFIKADVKSTSTDFHVPVDEHQRRPAICANSSPDHHRAWEEASFDQFCYKAFLSEQLAVILAVVVRLDRENFLVCEQHFGKATICDQVLHLPTFL